MAQSGFVDRSWWTPTLALVFAGEIPEYGAAVKDGSFYISGEEQGRVMKVEWQGSSWRIDYIRSKERDK